MSNSVFKNNLFHHTYIFQLLPLILRHSGCIIKLIGASRQRKNWDEVKKESTSSFEKIASPSSHDYDLLASSIFDFIELVMDLEAKEQFPSLETAQLLIQNKEEMNYFPTKISQVDGGIKLPTKNSETDDNGQSRETFSCSYESNYDANDATIDVPLQHDLAADKTLEILLSYSETLAENALKDENDKDEEQDFPPIMSQLSPYLLWDGNPIWGIYKHLRKNGDNYKRRMPAYFGGFHLVLETHKKRGSLFGESHLRDIFRNWRKSDKQLDWVMDPGDPSQIDDEMIMYHLGKFELILQQQ